MQPLYLARIEDLRHGDLVKVDCAACHDCRAADGGISALGEKLTPSNERSMSAFPQQRTFRNAAVTSALCQIAHIG